ncbi:MAG: hypothetical protein U0R19_06625 [Bryobacteraceae bacterium]
MKKLVVLLFLAVSMVSAIDIPMPQCLPCDPEGEIDTPPVPPINPPINTHH